MSRGENEKVEKENVALQYMLDSKTKDKKEKAHVV